ncbi:hypothetical protein FRC06_006568, partial [Ceratobasidium sp. 370]
MADGSPSTHRTKIMDRLAQNPSIGVALGSPGPQQAEITSPTFLSAEPSPFFSGTRTPPERT